MFMSFIAELHAVSNRHCACARGGGRDAFRQVGRGREGEGERKGESDQRQKKRKRGGRGGEGGARGGREREFLFKGKVQVREHQLPPNECRDSSIIASP